MAKTKKRPCMCRALDQPHVIPVGGFICTFRHKTRGDLLFTCTEHQTAVDKTQYRLADVIPVSHFS